MQVQTQQTITTIEIIHWITSSNENSAIDYPSGLSSMSYIFLQLIRHLIEAKDQSDKQIRERTDMGNSISSVTSLAGVHGPSVGIAVGVSVGVLLCLAAFQYYQNRQLKKRVQQLISVTPDMQVYMRPSAKNPFAYRNLGYGYNHHKQQVHPIQAPVQAPPAPNHQAGGIA